MSFDRVAPHYRWLETLVFGNQLQQARVAFVREIEAPLRILIVGEGNGRFLAELMRTGEPRVDCVEMSARMIALARKQVPDAHVNFIQADIRDLTLRQAHYDLIVSHFFFDCFTEGALAEIIARLANAAAPECAMVGRRFLLSDARLASLASARVDRGNVFFLPRGGRNRSPPAGGLQSVVAGEWLQAEEGAFIPAWRDPFAALATRRPTLRSG